MSISKKRYSVVAIVSPEGSAFRINTINHKSFPEISRMFPDHNETRLLIVSITGHHGFCVIDLWRTEVTVFYPFVSAAFLGSVGRKVFDDLDLVIGWCALSMSLMNEMNVVIEDD